jgi:hypothetical protein
MLTQHQHKPEEFDPGHCRACARQAGLLDHYDRVQREEARLRQTRMWASMARRSALWAVRVTTAIGPGCLFVPANQPDLPLRALLGPSPAGR